MGISFALGSGKSFVLLSDPDLSSSERKSDDGSFGEDAQHEARPTRNLDVLTPAVATRNTGDGSPRAPEAANPMIWIIQNVSDGRRVSLAVEFDLGWGSGGGRLSRGINTPLALPGSFRSSELWIPAEALSQ